MTITYIALTGIGATALMDLWGLARRKLFAVPAADYALVGRWVAHLARGKFRHDSIKATAAVRGELPLGWIAHYSIGIAFAALLAAAAGAGWFARPALPPALAIGIVTVLAPFLVMQPGMGAGVFASRTPRPGDARLQSLVTHAVFGFGLYLAGTAARYLLSGE